MWISVETHRRDDVCEVDSDHDLETARLHTSFHAILLAFFLENRKIEFASKRPALKGKKELILGVYNLNVLEKKKHITRYASLLIA